MHENEGLATREPAGGSKHRFRDVLDRLYLAEVVSSPDAAERSIERRCGKAGCGDRFMRGEIGGLVEPSETLCKALEAQFSRFDIEPIKAHAASDVRADQLRIDAIGEYRAADRPELARMQIGHGGNGFNACKRCNLLQLACGIALDPCFGRGEEVDRRAAVHSGRSAHDVVLSRRVRHARSGGPRTGSTRSVTSSHRIAQTLEPRQAAIAGVL